MSFFHENLKKNFAAGDETTKRSYIKNIVGEMRKICSKNPSSSFKFLVEIVNFQKSCIKKVGEKDFYGFRKFIIEWDKEEIERKKMVKNTKYKPKLKLKKGDILLKFDSDIKLRYFDGFPAAHLYGKVSMNHIKKASRKAFNCRNLLIDHDHYKVYNDHLNDEWMELMWYLLKTEPKIGEDTYDLMVKKMEELGISYN